MARGNNRNNGDGNFYFFDCKLSLKNDKDKTHVPHFSMKTRVALDSDGNPDYNRLVKTMDKENIPNTFVELKQGNGENLYEDKISGELVDIQNVDYIDNDGNEQSYCQLTLVDWKQEVSEKYQVRVNYSITADKFFNKIMNLNPSQPNWLELSVFMTKSQDGDKEYPFFNVTLNGQRIDWRFTGNNKDGWTKTNYLSKKKLEQCCAMELRTS